MTTEQEFFITLPSNVKTRGGNEMNTITCFKTQLKKRLIFDPNEDWRVGLSEIFYTRSWFNVQNFVDITFITHDGNTESINIPEISSISNGDIHPKNEKKICPGHYRDIEELISIVNSKLNLFKNKVDRVPSYSYDRIRNIVTVNTGLMNGGKETQKIILPNVGEEIENIFGLIYNGDTLSKGILKKYNISESKSFEYEAPPILLPIFTNGFLSSSRSPDINSGFYSMHVYSSIIEDNFVGDEYAPLLRTIPVHDIKKWGEIVKYAFPNIHYIPLRTKNFDTIEIDLRDDTGLPIPFQSGRVIVKLIFKKYA